MALTYNYANTAHAKLSDAEQKRLWSIVYTVIMQTMVIGIGHITDRNLREVIARLRYVEQLFGPLLVNKADGTGHYVSKGEALDVVRSLVGLRTNVPDESRPAFVRCITANWFLDAITTLAKEERQHAEAAHQVPA